MGRTLSILLFLIVTLLPQMTSNVSAKPQKKQKMKLTYIMDPLCGWCYGNSDNIANLREAFKEDYEFELLVGGMLVGDNRPQGGQEMHDFLKGLTPRLEATTGVQISPSFFKLIKDTAYTFSSLEPCAAIVYVKEKAPEHVFSFAKALQTIYYTSGKALSDSGIYSPLLSELGLDINDFKSHWLSEANLAKTRAEFQRAARLTRGFPSLHLEFNGSMHQLASGYFKYDAMAKQLSALTEE
jgi:putative protein-disulfide isomerase